MLICRGSFCIVFVGLCHSIESDLFPILFTVTGRLLHTLDSYETVIPTLVDENGNFLSYNLTQPSYRNRMKRGTRKRMNKVFYKLAAFGKEFHFELEQNDRLMSHGYGAELWGSSQRKLAQTLNCHYVGYSRQPHLSTAAISNCFGLVRHMLCISNFEKTEFHVLLYWLSIGEKKKFKNGYY